MPAFAKRFYSSPQAALGRQIGSGDKNKNDTTIVGVVGDIRHQNLRTEIGPAVYSPICRMNTLAALQIYVRTAQSPKSVEAAIRQAIHQLDPTLVVDGLRTMEEEVDQARRR